MGPIDESFNEDTPLKNNFNNLGAKPEIDQKQGEKVENKDWD